MLLSLAEVGQILGCSERTLYRLLKAGRLRPEQRRPYILVSSEEVERYLDSLETCKKVGSATNLLARDSDEF